MKNNFFVYLFVLIAGLFSYSQNSKEILCKVLDIETKVPVSFATIKFERIQNGVIADEDGEFRLPQDYKVSNKNIVISSIGFETLKVSVITLKDGIVNIIYLKPKVEALSAVLVTGNSKLGENSKGLTAKTIVKNAIGRILTNYPNSAHSYISYYRDYQLIKNNYYNLNEAILESFDAGFDTDKYSNRQNVTALYSYNLNREFYQDSLLLNSIYGKSKSISEGDFAKLGTEIQNELEILNIHNPIRNFNKSSFSFIYIFRDNFVNNHLFKLSNITYVEDIPLYEIDFVTRDDPGMRYMGSGKIYVSKLNYAIHRIEYRVYANRNYRSTRTQGNTFANVMSKPKNILFEVKVEYKSKNNKMYLNYMTFNNLFVIKKPNPFKVDDFLFNPKTRNFILTFNTPLDMSTIERKSNFRLRYKDKKLIIKEIKAMDDKTVKIKVVDWSAGLNDDITTIDSMDFSYKLKRIKNTFGATINQVNKISGYQFREYFTQEIFENKSPDEDLIYVDKTLPISATRTNKPSFDLGKYWVNSPLKKTKEANN
ncbi:MAG: carboxypeptidase-like regulatory domain-containing protein [Winogradskyella sp.]|uniref:carboxypeptidase-like regulatory domain-containing protein n=1 Tax=Winogradskyella sp. TaxID=1883156 RepID=UPI0025F4D56F|nr:carboxypeptidase-like regulatory domain-containing protein [Winogradskyella sp.]NRB84348.1 carboxypeptidase-like regulatory domain-containing protein [Winogradskyella sp.]